MIYDILCINPFLYQVSFSNIVWSLHWCCLTQNLTNDYIYLYSSKIDYQWWYSMKTDIPTANRELQRTFLQNMSLWNTKKSKCNRTNIQGMIGTSCFSRWGSLIYLTSQQSLCQDNLHFDLAKYSQINCCIHAIRTISCNFYQNPWMFSDTIQSSDQLPCCVNLCKWYESCSLCWILARIDLRANFYSLHHLCMLH